MSCYGFFHERHKDFGNLITDCTIAANTLTSRVRQIHRKLTLAYICVGRTVMFLTLGLHL
jgi:hypothetical protein